MAVQASGCSSERSLPWSFAPLKKDPLPCRDDIREGIGRIKCFGDSPHVFFSPVITLV